MKRAQDDSELLRSIVLPLEEQIVALKGKLRETDSLLQEYEKRQVGTRACVPRYCAADSAKLAKVETQ